MNYFRSHDLSKRRTARDLQVKRPLPRSVDERAAVLITAGASGIGRAIAERFDDAETRVFICDSDPSALENIRKGRPRIVGLLADVSDAHAVAGVFRRISDANASIHVLVNNAGVAGPRETIDRIEDEQWDRTIAVNLTGAFYCLREAARVMKQRRQGSIINISTSSVNSGLPNRTPYIVSKAGLMGLTRNAARELGPYNVRVNAVLPGYVDNARAANVTAAIAKERGTSVEEVRASALQFISMRTQIQPNDVAEMVFFLASPVARYISGQFIGVDGNQEWEG